MDLDVLAITLQSNGGETSAGMVTTYATTTHGKQASASSLTSVQRATWCRLTCNLCIPGLDTI